MGNLFFDKQPDEEFIISVEFTDRMTTGETIASNTVTAVNISTGADATDDVFDYATITGQFLYIRVLGGTSGISYKMTITITTSTGNILEEEVVIHVLNE